MKHFEYHNTSNSYKRLLIYTYFLLLTFLLSSTANSQILINEFQASNNSMVPEMYDFGDFPDWIELYNNSGITVDLANYTLTDDIAKPQKYVFPSSASIPPNGYFRIWADDFEAEPGEFHERTWEWADGFNTIYFHLPFKLSKSGEEIALYNTTGEMIDHIVFGPQLPDGSNNWVYFGDPTPEASNSTRAYTNTTISAVPKILPEGGFYNGSILVSVTSPHPSATLRYTLDGSLPNENSLIYTTPITVDSNKTVRVRAYEPDKLPAFAQSQAYNFDTKQFDIPIITLTTDPMFLWGYPLGIYDNELKQRNIPIKVEYFENVNKKVLSTYATMKLSGQYSYQYDLKPFTITARSKFGDDFLNYPFFNNVDNSQFKSIYLRNAGWPDIFSTYFRDALSHTIIYNKMDLDAQSYQPTATYLNGDFWGIYNIREKIKKNYFEYHHNADSDNIDLLEYDDYSTGPNVIIVNEGDSEDFDNIFSYLEDHNMSDSTNYEYIKTKIDVDEYINYMITEIFVSNRNWQHCNVKWWRERKEGAKWRWILLDTDYAFGIESNSSHNLLAETLKLKWSTFLFRKMNENQSFKDEFIQRFAAYMNTVFKKERTMGIIDSLKNNIANVIPYHSERWNTLFSWDEHVSAMRNFAKHRPTHQRQHIKDQYDISQVIDIDITVVGGEGKIYANDVWLWEGCLTGEYFAGVPIRLKAVPKAGYEFVEWEGVSTQRTIVTTLENDTEIKAIFAPTTECRILSEINEDVVLDSTCEYYIALDDIVINADATLHIEEGVEIRMVESANIIVHGSLVISGTEDSPVIITPNTRTEAQSWGGLCFDTTSDTSFISNLFLDHATKGDNDLFIGAISAYHSDIILEKVKVENVRKPFYSQYGNITINDCSFRSPYTCDLINIKYADMAIVENCELRGNDAVDTDAIDLDGVTTAIIKGNRIYGFNGFNSDGIDLGESCIDVLIEENLIYAITDKGISVGQASRCTLKQNVIIGCAQGVGIKDFDSYAYIDKNTFYGNEYAVNCYEKKVGFGGGKADIVNSILSTSIIASTYADDLSEISINYSLSDTESLDGTGNLELDPLFIDESILNLELQEDSPCIDAGDPTSPLDPDNTIVDMGAHYTFSESTEEYTVVINEINYNSPNNENNSKDWVEIHNYGDTAVDLSGWYFFDDKFTHKYIFKKGVIIQSGSYMVIGNDAVLFENVYGTELNYLGSFDFGLGNSGDIARLFDSNLSLVDIVAYEDTAPWPECADGKGASLMLIDPLLDNSLPESWAIRCELPTPGINNHECSANFDFEIKYGCSGLIEFTNKSSGISDMVTWDFGDGESSTSYNPTHLYEDSEIYNIQLQVIGNGNSNSTYKTLVLESILEAPEVIGGYHCGHGTIELQSISLDSSFWYENETTDSPIYKGDNFTTPTIESTTTYYVANYLDTCSSIRVPVEAVIYEEVVADFEFTTDEYEVIFENKSSNAAQYIWDFGDGENSMESSDFMTHTYNEKGTFTVSLSSYNESENCDSTVTKEVIIQSLSTEDHFTEDIIYINPNPFVDKVNIQFLNNNNQVFIEVSDTNGKILHSSILYNTNADEIESIDLSNIPAGIYLFKIQTEKDIVVHQIVKK